MSKQRDESYWWMYVLSGLIVLIVSLISFAPSHHVAYAEPNDPGPFNRLLNWGFFWNTQHNNGDSVIPAGVHSTSVPQLINDITSRAENQGGGWSLQDIRGAQFIIKTMLGNTPNPNALPTQQDIDDWVKSIYSLVNNGGSINFDTPIFFNINSYWQNPGDPRGDDAFYDINHGAYVWNPFGFDPDGKFVGNSIAFYDSNGNQIYAIRQACGNPVGNMSPLPKPISYDLNPVINATVNGAAPASLVAEPGDTITFDFRVNNTTGTPSDPASCSTNNVNHAGYYAVNPGSPEGGGAPLPNTCPQVFGGNSSTSIATQTVAAAANTTVCRTLFVTPATDSGATRGTEACVVVASKPYLRVYGGDVSAGNGLETAPNTCTATTNSNGSIVAWNKEGGGGYAGAGSQYAAFSLNTITDFASALGNVGGAPPATGLSFANNNTNPSSGIYGNDFGTASCITDYYGQMPSAGVANLSSLAHGTGVYQSTGNTTFPGGTLNAGDRWTIYVDGDLTITGSIKFPANWTAATLPTLEVIVRGNIFIGGSVDQLDGLYVAQKNGGSGGTIYTCATGTPLGPTTTANGAFYNSCTTKLTVNGALVADSVQFTRTRGTLAQSSAGESGASNNIAEVFNYGPMLWMGIPAQTNSHVDNYDAITSLPPVL